MNEEIKIAYVHVPTFFNAHTVQKEENKIENKGEWTNEECLFVVGILLLTIIVSLVILWFLNKIRRD